MLNVFVLSWPSVILKYVFFEFASGARKQMNFREGRDCMSVRAAG